MSRFQAYGQSDNQWKLDGDPSFRGIDMLHDRSTLPPGYLARAENKRLRDGVAKTRLGTAMPGDFNPGFSGPVVGSAVYNNPNGSEMLLVAVAGEGFVWALQFGRDPIKVNLKSPESLGNYQVELVQAFDKVLLMRRPVTLSPWDKNPHCTFAIDGTGDITASRAHGYTAGTLVRFESTGDLPASINVNTNYFVIAAGLTATKFRISATAGGAAIIFATAGSAGAVHTVGTLPAVPMLQWDGNVNHTFDPIALAPPGQHLVDVAWNAEPFESHLIYYSAMYSALPQRDQVTVSDILNYTSYDGPLAVFRINAGESNMITRVMTYFRSSIVIFMKQSVHMLSGFTSIDQTTLLPEFTKGQQRMLSQHGSVGNKMPLQDGADVIFLSQPDGFYRLGEIIQDQIAVEPTPLSRNIQPIIEQIHWDRAYQYACSAGLGDYAYFALPLKGSSGENDCIVVYNRTNREWESAPDSWSYPNFRIQRLHTTLYDGARSLFAIGRTGDNYNVYLLYNGLMDEVGGSALPVEDVMETRGYTLGDPTAFKRVERMVIGLQTYDPDIKITALNDGVNEQKVVTSIEKDRRRSYIHGHADLDFNPDEDAETIPRREDYSIIPRFDFASEDFEEYPDGPLVFIAGTPNAFNGVKQESLERFQVRQNTRWVSFRVENANGQCDVLNVAVEGYNAQETVKVIA